jgi:Rps23 Pro-64 3,4-dihydroxylase Tpa1-like proline 4-hydroxylase
VKKITPFYFNSSDLQKLAEKHRSDFLDAGPFPHVVIDNFLPEEVLNQIVDEFPGPDEDAWTMWGPGDIKHTKNKNVEKLGTSDEEVFGPMTRHFMAQLNSYTFVQFMEELTKSPYIIVDPAYNGCGLHSTGRGGKLMVHVDGNRHPNTFSGMMHQRFNLILYLNKDWEEEYGGHLELWNRDATECIKKVQPIFNRCLIFDTGSFSYHGHPEPLACPEGRRRNSLAVYYYQLQRDVDASYSGMQRTVKWAGTQDGDSGWRSKDWMWILKVESTVLAKRLLPPIVADMIRSIKRKLS